MKNHRVQWGVAAGLGLCVAAGVAGVAGAAEPKTITSSVGTEMILIPAGTFMMGSPAPAKGGKTIDPSLRNVTTQSEDELRMLGTPTDEFPRHKVTISKPFYLGKYEVTQAEWDAVMGPGKNPSKFKGPKLPVEETSWNAAQAFIKKLNEKEGGDLYRLPTEAEWEYAARAGSTAERYGEADEIGWYGQNSDPDTFAPLPVGGKKPNAWGLHDMLGNVWEWVNDWYAADYYAKSPEKDPPGPPSHPKNYRSCRGSATDNYHRLRAADRGKHGINGDDFVLGFRLAKSIK